MDGISSKKDYISNQDNLYNTKKNNLKGFYVSNEKLKPLNHDIININKKTTSNNIKTTNIQEAIIEETPSKLGPQSNNWKLYTEDGFNTILEEFAIKNKEARKIMDSLKLYNLKFSFQQARSNPSIFGNILTEICETLGINPNEPPKVYRFISDRELNALKRDGKVKPQRYADKMDVTINPDLNWGKYRLTFKQEPRFSILGDSDSKLEPNRAHESEGYFYIKDGYSIDDIEKIEVFNGQEYVEI